MKLNPNFSLSSELNVIKIFINWTQVSGSLLRLLVLGLALVRAQDDPAAGDEGGAPDAGGEEGGDGGGEGADEAWEYVEFLKQEVK